MKVKEIMINDITTCAWDSDLASVAMQMWDKDCGVVPVTDEQGKPVGMITDRDISIAGATQDRRLSEIPVSSVKDGNVVTCSGDQDVKDAMQLMSISRVRRLPVVDPEGRLTGIMSMGDVIAWVAGADDGEASQEISSREVIDTLKSVYIHH